MSDYPKSPQPPAEDGDFPRLPQPPEPGAPSSLGGLRRREEVPQYMRPLLWVWIVVSVLYLAMLLVLTLLLFFSPEGDFRYRMLPEPPGAGTWILIGVAWVLGIARLAASIGLLRRERAEASVKAAWIVLVVTMALQIFDAITPVARMTLTGDSSFTPRIVGVLAGATLIGLLAPPVVRWVWRRGAKVVPYQTYYTEIALEEEIRQLRSGEAEVRLPTVRGTDFTHADVEEEAKITGAPPGMTDGNGGGDSAQPGGPDAPQSPAT